MRQLWFRDDEVFFCCKVCVRFRLFEDLPADCVPFIFALQFPDVFTEFGAVLAFFVVKGRLVISPSCFEVNGR